MYRLAITAGGTVAVPRNYRHKRHHLSYLGRRAGSAMTDRCVGSAETSIAIAITNGTRPNPSSHSPPSGVITGTASSLVRENPGPLWGKPTRKLDLSFAIGDSGFRHYASEEPRSTQLSAARSRSSTIARSWTVAFSSVRSELGSRPCSYRSYALTSYPDGATLLRHGRVHS